MMPFVNESLNKSFKLRDIFQSGLSNRASGNAFSTLDFPSKHHGNNRIDDVITYKVVGGSVVSDITESSLFD